MASFESEMILRATARAHAESMRQHRAQFHAAIADLARECGWSAEEERVQARRLAMPFDVPTPVEEQAAIESRYLNRKPMRKLALICGRRSDQEYAAAQGLEQDDPKGAA